MKRRTSLMVLISLLFLGSYCWADEKEEKRVQIQLQVFKIRADISGKTSLTDHVWEGLDHPPYRLTRHGPFKFFVLAELTIGNVKFVANEKAWTWDGKDRPPSDSGIKLLAEPQILGNLGNKFSISLQSTQPIEYFEKRKDGLFEHHRIPEANTGLAISTRVEKGPSNRIILRDFTISLDSVSQRKPIKGVALNVGKPVFDRERLKTSASFKPGRYYAIEVMTKKEGMLLLRLRVDWVERKKARDAQLQHQETGAVERAPSDLPAAQASPEVVWRKRTTDRSAATW